MCDDDDDDDCKSAMLKTLLWLTDYTPKTAEHVQAETQDPHPPTANPLYG